jgi:hypothetical protein
MLFNKNTIEALSRPLLPLASAPPASS